MLRVLIFEDNDGLRESLSALISGAPGLALVGAYGTADQAELRVRQLTPDVVLMDIDMPGRNGLVALTDIKSVHPDVDVVMLTVFDSGDRIFEAIRGGATGYLLKRTPPHKLVEALEEVRQGGAPMTASVARQVLEIFPRAPGPAPEQLTAQEQSILRHLVDGFSYKMIAGELGIAFSTVSFHIKNLYRKLHVHSAPEAVAMALKRRLV